MTRFGFVRAAITREQAWWYGAALTLVCVGLATVLRSLLGNAATDVPFVTYYPAMMVCTLLAGWRYGVAATILSVAIVDFLFIRPSFAFTTDARTMVTGVLFVLSCFIIVAIAQTLRRTFLELERTNERVRFLNRELRHRVRNTLAVVQALAEQSARSRPDDFLPALTSRLRAMAEAHDVLSRGDGGTCHLEAVVEKACRPFSNDGNITLQGPSCCLPGDTCVPLTLAIHELYTNAVKYGALSQPGGKVFVTWDEREDGRAQVVWEEAGGPAVFPPKRKGLGTILLGAQPELRDSQLEFHPRGVRCSFCLEVVEGAPPPLSSPSG